MNKALLLLLVLIVNSAHAQRTSDPWQQAAAREFPELAVQSSRLNQLFVAEKARLKTDKPQFFSSPNWPVILARQCAMKIKQESATGQPARTDSTSAVLESGTSKQIKVECRLLEMSFQQADAIEATLLRWERNPSEQTHQLDGILSGLGARKLAELTGAAASGEKCKAGGLEFEGVIGPDGSTCNMTLVFNMANVYPDTNLLKSNCSFTSRNGLPVVLSRIHFGNTEGIVVARCTWEAHSAPAVPPIAASSPSKDADSPVAKTDPLITKEWTVRPDLIPRKTRAGEAGGLPVLQSAKEWLISSGVKFGAGTSANYVVANNRLAVRNTAEQIKLINAIVSHDFGNSLNLTIECSLVEMPSGLANQVESTLMRWLANPSEQARQLDTILKGAGVKRIASLSGVAKSGQRGVVQKLDKPIYTIPYGANPATWPRQQTHNIGDTLEFESVLGPDGRTCDVNCVFTRTLPKDASHRIEDVKPTTSFSALNGLPVVLGRRDFGTNAELVLAKVTWAAQASGNSPMPTQVYVRARVVGVSHAIASEADKVKDDPKALAEWLKKRGTTQALVAITTKSGQRAVFEHIDEIYYLVNGGNAAEVRNLGTSIEVEPVIGPDLNTIDITARVMCYQQKDQPGLFGSQIVGRVIVTNKQPKALAIAAGGSAAVPCIEDKIAEELQTKGLPAVYPQPEPVDDVFVVFEPMLPDSVGGGPHFYNTN